GGRGGVGGGGGGGGGGGRWGGGGAGGGAPRRGLGRRAARPASVTARTAVVRAAAWPPYLDELLFDRRRGAARNIAGFGGGGHARIDGRFSHRRRVRGCGGPGGVRRRLLDRVRLRFDEGLGLRFRRMPGPPFRRR